MNKSKLLRLANVIEKQPVSNGKEGFGMDRVYYLDWGDAPSSILGWTLHLEGCDFEDDLAYEDMWDEKAAGILEINEHDAERLFWLKFSTDGYNYHSPRPSNFFITPKHAAETIRHFVETGEVNWRKGKEREQKRKENAAMEKTI